MMLFLAKKKLFSCTAHASKDCVDEWVERADEFLNFLAFWHPIDYIRFRGLVCVCARDPAVVE